MHFRQGGVHSFWQQDAGTETRFGLIAIYGEVFPDLRAKIFQRVLGAVECYICIRYQPFSISVAEYFIKRSHHYKVWVAGRG